MSASALASAAAFAPGAVPPRTPSPAAAFMLLGTVAAAAIAASAWMLPGMLERGRIALDRGDVGAVREMVRTASERERLAAGDVMPLLDIAMQQGDTDSAVALLRAFLRTNPDHVGALRELAEVLEQARRHAELAETLERLHALTNEAEPLARAAVLWGQIREPERRLRALRVLLARGEADDDAVMELARDRIRRNERAAAVEMLLDWLRAAPRPSSLVAAHAGLLAVDLPDAGAILIRLAATLTGPTGAEAVRQVTRGLLQLGRGDLAARFLDALPPAIQTQPDAAIALATAEFTAGQTAPALARVLALREAGTLPEASMPFLADVAVAERRFDLAVEVAAAIPPALSPPWLALRLSEALPPTERDAALARIPAANLAGQPAVAALAAAARGDREAARRWARSALGSLPEAVTTLDAFTALLRDLDLHAQAFAEARDAARSGSPDPAALRVLAALADTPARQAEALPLLASARDAGITGASLAWSEMALAADRIPELSTWLRGGGRAEPNLLLQLLLRGVARRDGALARLAGDALLARTDLPPGWTGAELRLLRDATGPLDARGVAGWLDFIAAPSTGTGARERAVFILSGHPDLEAAARAARLAVAQHAAFRRLAEEAGTGGEELHAARLRVLVALSPGLAAPLLAQAAGTDPVRYGPLHVAALLQQAGQGGVAVAALRALLPRLPAAARETALFTALHAAPAEAKPLVQALGAATLGGSWNNAFEESLLRAGRTAELAAILRARAADASLSREQRRALAGRLAELGDRPAAIAALRALSDRAAPDAPEVRQLVYLWGPRRAPEAVEWAGRRADSAPPAELPRWLEFLDYFGAPEAIAAAIEARPELLGRDARLAAAYSAALSRLGTPRRAAPLLERAIAAASDPAVLAVLGPAAEASGQPALALRAADTVAAARPRAPEALLAAARAATAARRPAQAADHYAALLATRAPQPPQVMLNAGEALIAADRRAEARPVLIAGLDRLGAGDGSQAQARLRARFLFRLGRARDSAAILRDLVTRDPGNAGLRADLLESELAVQDR
ncbi:hypothetical protein [Muricoccus radiodurans]|uniref:hypothetical protein n=1 Tax=Muricoccus radiodurans TaxID=2231721 RepID=UPI003CF361D9